MNGRNLRPRRLSLRLLKCISQTITFRQSALRMLPSCPLRLRRMVLVQVVESDPVRAEDLESDTILELEQVAVAASEEGFTKLAAGSQPRLQFPHPIRTTRKKRAARRNKEPAFFG